MYGPQSYFFILVKGAVPFYNVFQLKESKVLGRPFRSRGQVQRSHSPATIRRLGSDLSIPSSWLPKVLFSRI